LLDLVRFLADVPDGEAANRPALEQSDRLARGAYAVRAETLGFAFPAVEGHDVANALDPNCVSPAEAACGDSARLTSAGVGPFHGHPAGRVAFVRCDEVEPLTTRGRGFVGVDDGVIAEAIRAPTALAATGSVEKAVQARCRDGALDDGRPAEPLRLV